MRKANLFIIITAVIIVASCRKKDTESLATLTTLPVTNIDLSAMTATSGGNISNNGGSPITASGVCWSKVNNTPTIANDTTQGPVASGSFTSTLNNITASTTWYVRAYAINGVGIAYGNVITFATGNGAPTANGIVITGTAKVQELLNATYVYSDPENDVESGTTFQWYRSNDGSGTGEIAISGATNPTYRLVAADETKYIRVGITAKALTGSTPGIEAKSSFVGPVLSESTSITFTYNGVSVTYGIIISPATSRRWLDRNLGAPNTPSSLNDFANFGDAFQWGRGPDGHQLTVRGSGSASTTGVNGTETSLSSSDVPGHNKFILAPITPFDWRATKNDNLWQGVNGVNNPCPLGFRLPTKDEWTAEGLTTGALAYNQLKLTLGGRRNSSNGNFSQTTANGQYWSSSVLTSAPTQASYILIANSTPYNESNDNRADGKMCRCIKE